MARSNQNDGFIYSGTTKDAAGVDVIHVFKTDDNFNTLWSYYYSLGQNKTLNSTKIVGKVNDEYWVSGYYGPNTDPVAGKIPFVMRINSNGIVQDHTVGFRDEDKGVFLDVEPCSDGSCIAVGFVSPVISEIVNTGTRRGLIVKFDSNLNVQWSKTFHYTSHEQNDNSFYDLAENVTVINSVHTGYTDQYFISGSITGQDPTLNSIEYLFVCYLNNAGGLLYKKTILQDGAGLDVCYDPADNSVYILGKLDAFNLGVASMLCKMNAASGTLNYLYYYEGQNNGAPFPHVPIGYKIALDGDYLRIFGHVREYFNNNTNYDTLMIPFHATLNKANASQVDFYISHTDENQTLNYPSEDPGFLHAYDNASSTFTKGFPSLYVPEMAAAYYVNEQFRWGMIGYSHSPLYTSRYVLNLLGSLQQECAPLSRNLEFAEGIEFNIESIFADFNFQAAEHSLQQSSVGLSDESCQ